MVSPAVVLMEWGNKFLSDSDALLVAGLWWWWGGVTEGIHAFARCGPANNHHTFIKLVINIFM